MCSSFGPSSVANNAQMLYFDRILIQEIIMIFTIQNPNALRRKLILECQAGSDVHTKELLNE